MPIDELENLLAALLDLRLAEDSCADDTAVARIGKADTAQPGSRKFQADTRTENASSVF